MIRALDWPLGSTRDFISDSALVANGESIASEGKGEYMYVEGRVLGNDGTPVPNATIETWETDDHGARPRRRRRGVLHSNELHTVGFYDTQYASREKPDCRGRLKTDADGRYGYRAVVPVAYPIPGDVSNVLSPSHC